MIFLSYCQKEEREKELVKQIYDFFNNDNDYKGKVFLDSESLKYGEGYWKNISKEINDSDFFIFFNSKSYLDSATCWKEIHIAIKALRELKIKKIIEVKIGNAETHSCISRDKLYITLDDKVEVIIEKLISSFSFNDLINKTLNKTTAEKIIILEFLKNVINKEEINEEFSMIEKAIIKFLVDEVKIISKKKIKKVEYITTSKLISKYKLNSLIKKMFWINISLGWENKVWN